jgi:oligogalacturonide lyase
MIEFTDRLTSARVLQVTDGPAISHPSYFLQSSFFPGGESMFFTSYRTGSPQLFEISLNTGETRQLTRGQPIHPFSAALHPGFRELVLARSGTLWAVDLATLSERLIAEIAGGQLGECSISCDGEWLTAAYKRGSECGLVVASFDGSTGHTIPFPRTVIHPQFHPLDPEWIEFSGDPAPRMHRVRRDGSGMECLYHHGNDVFVVHETFLGSTGDLVFTIWPRALCRMDWTTRQIRTITDYKAWHIAPDKRGERVLCDTNHPDKGLQLIDVSTGERQPICLTESSNQGSQWRKSSYALAEDFANARNTLSWMENAADTVYGPQWTHPHPSWSLEETKVAFASDRTGVTQVYVVELPACAASPLMATPPPL